MIKRRKTKDFEPPFLLFFCSIILLFFASIISANLIFKTPQITLPSTQTSIHNQTYLNSLPAPDQVLASNPINIVINFKTKVISGSEILLLKDSKKVNFSPTILDIDRTSIRQLVNSSLSDGAYTVIYKTCTAKNVCDNGNFNFYINKKISESYSNFLFNNETSIIIHEGTFSPKNLKISPGTTVIWTNNDTNIVSIHSDPFPQNNYFPILTSPPLSRGKTFRLVFNKQGLYPYYLDSGVNNYIFGNIIVQ